MSSTLNIFRDTPSFQVMRCTSACAWYSEHLHVRDSPPGHACRFRRMTRLTSSTRDGMYVIQCSRCNLVSSKSMINDSPIFGPCRGTEPIATMTNRCSFPERLFPGNNHILYVWFKRSMFSRQLENTCESEKKSVQLASARALHSEKELSYCLPFVNNARM
jgi:hypothetical protein